MFMYDVPSWKPFLAGLDDFCLLICLNLHIISCLGAVKTCMRNEKVASLTLTIFGHVVYRICSA